MIMEIKFEIDIGYVLHIYEEYIITLKRKCAMLIIRTK